MRLPILSPRRPEARAHSSHEGLRLAEDLVSEAPSPPSPWTVGRRLYRVEVDGRRAFVETWEVTQHRKKGRVHFVACLRRTDPPPVTFKTLPPLVKRDKVPLSLSLQQSEYAASIGAAVNKAIERLEADVGRLTGYLDEAESEEERTETRADLQDLKYAKTAMLKLH